LPLRTRELPAGPLISPLPFRAKTQVQGLWKVARVRGKPDHLDIVLRVQSQDFPFIVKWTVAQDQKDR
jgi:hypothetical protein